MRLESNSIQDCVSGGADDVSGGADDVGSNSNAITHSIHHGIGYVPNGNGLQLRDNGGYEGRAERQHRRGHHEHQRNASPRQREEHDRRFDAELDSLEAGKNLCHWEQPPSPGGAPPI